MSNLLSLPASGDLSAKQCHFVKIDSNGQVALAGAGEAAVGVLYSKPRAQGEVCTVDLLDGRQLRVIAGGPISAGDRVASDADGAAKVATAGATSSSHVLGVALADASAGDVMSIVGLALGAVPTTPA